MPVPVAARSKAWVCGPSPAGIVGSNPAGVMDLSFVCCKVEVLKGRRLCFDPITLPEESYQLWCVWVWSWILNNEEDVAH